MIDIFSFLSIFLTAGNAGLLFAHALEMPPKLRLSGRDYLMTQRIYALFGRVGIVTEPGALISTVVLAILLAGTGVPFVLTLVGLIALVAIQAIFFTVTQPINRRWARLDPEAPGPEWTGMRDGWERSHAIRAALAAVALAALILAALTAP